MEANFAVKVAKSQLLCAELELDTQKERLNQLHAQHAILQKVEASLTMIYNDPQLRFRDPLTAGAQEWNTLSDVIHAHCDQWRRDLRYHQLKLEAVRASIPRTEAKVERLQREFEVIERAWKERMEREERGRQAGEREARKREAGEREARESEARESEAREREAREREAREQDRLRKEAKARERLREQMREQQSKQEKDKQKQAVWEETMRRESPGITPQRAKRYQQQATDDLKDYASLNSFPDPLSEPCKNVSCQRDSDRALRACACNIKKCFVGLNTRELKEWRNKWHPDKFARCQGGKKTVESMQRKAKEIFQVLEEMHKEAAAKEKW